LAVVGLAEVLTHTPRSVTAAPPSDVTFPPLTAVLSVIEVAAVVVTVGDVSLKKILATKASSAPLNVKSGPPVTGNVASVERVVPET
jgi:hypothetical protein